MLEIPFNPSISADQKFQVLIPEQMVITLRLLWNSRASAGIFGPWRFLGHVLDFARRIGGMGGRKCSGVER